jgi:type II secretory pathway pseudopilin PulG
MHFHLPKPLHGWREFAGEVGIIVIGVLIALGVEQVVQAFHDRKVARDAREAINLEIAADLYDLGKRTRTEPCITRRLNEIDALIGSATQAGPVKPLLWIGRPQVWTVQESAWTSASQAGRTALFSPSDQNDYAAVYALMETVRSAELHEQDVWGWKARGGYPRARSFRSGHSCRKRGPTTGT